MRKEIITYARWGSACPGPVRYKPGRRAVISPRAPVIAPYRLNAYKRKACELLTSEEGIKERGRRCIEPEAVFGQMKSNMAYRRFRHMGKDKVVMDFTFFAIAFNIKKLCSMMRKVDKKGRKASFYGKFMVIFICYMHKLEICQDKFEKMTA